MPALIFVAGMARSGTSALTRLIALSGAKLPATLLGPGAGNPTGHWEPWLAVRLNDLYLSRAGSSFWDVSLRVQRESDALVAERARFIKKIKWLLQLELQRGDVFVLKEPRVSVLFDCWLAAAAQAGFTCKVIHTVRHPEEVAASLQARDRLGREAAYLLWIKYNLLAERDARNCPRVFLSYEDILTDWQGSLRRAIDVLGLDLEMPSARSVAEFLSPGLRHHTRPIQVVDDPTAGRWAQRTFAMLRGAAAEDIDTEGMDRVFAEFARWDSQQRGGADRRPRLSKALDSFGYTQLGLHLHRLRHQVVGEPRAALAALLSRG